MMSLVPDDTYDAQFLPDHLSPAAATHAPDSVEYLEEVLMPLREVHLMMMDLAPGMGMTRNTLSLGREAWEDCLARLREFQEMIDMSLGDIRAASSLDKEDIENAWFYLSRILLAVQDMDADWKYLLLRAAKGHYKDIDYKPQRKYAATMELEGIPQDPAVTKNVHHIGKRALGGVSLPTNLLWLDVKFHDLIHAVTDTPSLEKIYNDLRNDLAEAPASERQGIMERMRRKNYVVNRAYVNHFDRIDKLCRYMHDTYISKTGITRHERSSYVSKHLEHVLLMRNQFVQKAIYQYFATFQLYAQNVEHFQLQNNLVHISEWMLRLQAYLEDAELRFGQRAQKPYEELLRVLQDPTAPHLPEKLLSLRVEPLSPPAWALHYLSPQEKYIDWSYRVMEKLNVFMTMQKRLPKSFEHIAEELLIALRTALPPAARKESHTVWTEREAR